MSAPRELPHSGRDVFKPRFPAACAYRSVVAFFDLTGLWKYPVAASGDLETMGFFDVAYWVYKARAPVTRAVRGSGLESFFAAQRAPVWTAPDGFEELASLSLSAAGDLMNHAYLARSHETLYAEVDEAVFGADVAMANLECVVRDASAPLTIGSKTAALYLEPRAFDVVTGYRGRQFAFVATACNHSLDFGEAGVDGTIAALRQRGIAFNGINATEEDVERATLIEKNGIRLGVVSYAFGLNALKPPPGRARIVNRMALHALPDRVDFTQLDAQLRHCRAMDVDFVIAQLHWGMEFEMYPRPQQVELAHHLAERGVDAVFGHHPHVLQPVEFYRTRRDPSRTVPIYYSLGNLTNPFTIPFMSRSGIARVELVKGRAADGVKTYVRRASVTPVEQRIAAGSERIRLRVADS